MILYNQLSATVFSQILVLFFLGVFALVLYFLIFKNKPSKKLIAGSILIALGLSLLSTIVATGGYSGTVYREIFGWPVQFHTVIRNTEFGTAVSMPISFHFDFIKFAADSSLWFFVSFAVATLFVAVPRRKKEALCVSLFLVAFFALVFCFSLSNSKLNRGPSLPRTATVQEDGTRSQRENVLEAWYPEFKNFEGQESFAGKSVIYKADGTDYYFAYLTLGSGLPIAKAVCFKVDKDLKVFKVGEFPDPLDSFLGYKTVDPKTCKGIK